MIKIIIFTLPMNLKVEKQVNGYGNFREPVLPMLALKSKRKIK